MVGEIDYETILSFVTLDDDFLIQNRNIVREKEK